MRIFWERRSNRSERRDSNCEIYGYRGDVSGWVEVNGCISGGQWHRTKRRPIKKLGTLIPLM